MFFALIFCALTFADSSTLATQISLDRRGFSCNQIDGQWGRKSQAALLHYCTDNHRELPSQGENASKLFFSTDKQLFITYRVTEEELASLITIPSTPQQKAELEYFGYESIKEMYAERGHVSQRALERLNPDVDWNHLCAGTKIKIPRFPTLEYLLAEGSKPRKHAPTQEEATLLCISLSRFEISAFNSAGKRLAVFPCSIARNKAQLPPYGTLTIVTAIAFPNYTYTQDYHLNNHKKTRYIFPPGPNNPVGVAWLGLSLPGYGIHGTPSPQSIGNAESHGCFRLSNWNAARLFTLCRIGTQVKIEK